MEFPHFSAIEDFVGIQYKQTMLLLLKGTMHDWPDNHMQNLWNSTATFNVYVFQLFLID
jgi:hypothetical protein